MPFPASEWSAGSDEHDTPPEFFNPIAEAVGGFDLDPCASETSDLAKVNVRKSRGEDGLNLQWDGRVWLNPPYSEVSEWLQYAVRQHRDWRNTDLIVALVFARTSTQWWQNYANTADLWCFVEGRLTFGNGDYNAPAPSAVLVWGSYPEQLLEVLHEKGIVVHKHNDRWQPTFMNQHQNA